MSINIKTTIANLSEDDVNHLSEFMTLYDIETFQTSAINGMIKPIKGIKKNCRYCKREEPLVSFKEKTHFIPELLNGSKSISYFECDSCNKIFSKYENDFGRYTQFDRALFGLKKKKSRSSKI